MQYKYTGKTTVAIAGVGIVQAGQTVETDKVINHPLFKEQRPTRSIDQQPKTEKKSKSKKANRSV